MNKEFEIYKYYKGEKENPFKSKDVLSSRWWEGERMYHEGGEGHPDLHVSYESKLKEYIKKGYVSGPLIDESIPIEKRALLLFLDLWSGKWFLYEDNPIKTY